MLYSLVYGSISRPRMDHSNDAAPIGDTQPEIGLYLAQALLVAFTVYTALSLQNYDFLVPFNYGGDTLHVLMHVQGLLLNRLPYLIPQLSAPDLYNAAAFPVNTLFDWLILSLVSSATDKPGVALNAFWIITIVLTAWSTTFVLRVMHIGRLLAYPSGVIYAFLPFAWLRNVGHLPIVYYLVPLLSVLAISVATTRIVHLRPYLRYVLYGACVAQGIDYIYFTFYSLVLMAFSTTYGWFNYRSGTALRIGIVSCGLLVAAATVNLLPTVISWYRSGKPAQLQYKAPAEAEYYGAKIRRMLAPHPGNPIALLGKWGRRDAHAQFPNDNENTTARLGPVCSLGFLILIAISLRLIRPREYAARTTLAALAALNLFTILVITVGGFGAVFNLLVAPDIRCYNRFSVYCAFFSLAAICFVVQCHWRTFTKPAVKALYGAACCVALMLTLYDQMLDRLPLIDRQEADQQQYHDESKFFARYQQMFPTGACALQLPLASYPLNLAQHQFSSYDHLRPFFHCGKQFRWSYPAFSNRLQAWQDRLTSLRGDAMVTAAISSGFTVCLIDRTGYTDAGDEVIADLTAAGGAVCLAGDRYAVVDLTHTVQARANRSETGQSSHNSDNWLSPPIVAWGDGFSVSERNPNGISFRWSDKTSQLSVINTTKRPRTIAVSFILGSEDTGDVVLTTKDLPDTRLRSNVAGVFHTLEIHLSAEEKADIFLEARLRKLTTAPMEKRNLYFYVMDLKCEYMD